MINDEGDIVVPVDPRCLGLWLTGLFGDPDTTDNLDGSWDHEFASGGDDLPSYTIEVGMPKVPAFFLHAGVKLNSIALEFTRSGPAAAAINAIAQGETRFGTTQGGTPTSLTFSRISQFQGSIKRGGNPVGNLTGGSVTYSNNLEKIETIRDDGLIEGADPTIAALTGRIDVRFADTTLIDLAADGTPVDLEFAYTLSAQAKLVLTAHEVCPSPSLRSRARRRAGELRLPRCEERRRRTDAHRHAHERPRRVGLWLTDPAGSCLRPDNLGVI
jgi:Phage tail tube protein